MDIKLVPLTEDDREQYERPFSGRHVQVREKTINIGKRMLKGNKRKVTYAMIESNVGNH